MSTEVHQRQLAGTRWEPNQYLKFADHRLRPALELLHRVPLTSPSVIYDLGCGSGNITRMLAERWPSATVYGLDHSPEMLAQAAKDPGTVQWIEADISQWQPEAPPDLIFSNAALHWVEAHHELFPRLVHALNPGGFLAVQMPLSWDAPSHRLMREALAQGGSDGQPIGSADLRHAMDRNWVENAEAYYELLASDTTHLDIWETEYIQILEGDDPVFEWVKGTGLRPILNALNERELNVFLDGYRRRLREAYPMRTGGRTLYPFRRLFIVATV